MKNLFYITILMISLLLGGCHLLSNESGEKEVEKGLDESASQEVQGKEAVNKEETEEDEDEPAEEEAAKEQDKVENAEDLLRKTVAAMEEVSGVKVNGTIESTMNFMGMNVKENQQIDGELSMSPFAQHLHTVTESSMEGSSTAEMYMTEDRIYVNAEEGSGWVSLPTESLEGFKGFLLSEATLHHFLTFHETFNFEEKEDAYTFSFQGEGEAYKEIIFGHDHKMFEIFSDAIKEIEGSFKFTIDKETFYVLEVQMTVDQTVG